VVGLGLAWVQSADVAENPRVQPVLDSVRGDAPIVLLGNSVTLTALDPVSLGADNAAVSGGVAAHWVASASRLSGRERVILYVSPLGFDDLEVEDPDDQDVLLQLLASSDPELTARAMPGSSAGSAWGVLKRQRVAARRSLVNAVARGPTELVLGWNSHNQVVEPALNRLFPQELGPNEAEVDHTLDAELGSERWVEPWPDEAALDASLMPMLIERVQDGGARLVVVLPVGKDRQPCDGDLAPTRAWWSGQPVDLVDFSTEAFPGGTLSGDYHATQAGRERISRRLAEVLAELPPVDPDAPGRPWGACF